MSNAIALGDAIATVNVSVAVFGDCDIACANVLDDAGVFVGVLVSALVNQ